jgi:hypothetical protein
VVFWIPLLLRVYDVEVDPPNPRALGIPDNTRTWLKAQEALGLDQVIQKAGVFGLFGYRVGLKPPLLGFMHFQYRTFLRKPPSKNQQSTHDLDQYTLSTSEVDLHLVVVD